jgi:hypothetical protein
VLNAQTINRHLRQRSFRRERQAGTATLRQ